MMIGGGGWWCNDGDDRVMLAMITNRLSTKILGKFANLVKIYTQFGVSAS